METTTMNTNIPAIPGKYYCVTIKDGFIHVRETAKRGRKVGSKLATPATPTPEPVTSGV